MLDLSGKRVLVIGLGISGISAAKFCAERGASVFAADDSQKVDTTEIESFAEITLGSLPDPRSFDLVVPSPGVARSRYAHRANTIWGDIELTFRAMSTPIIAITGTNGKSSTVRLIETFLNHIGLRVRAAGNIGEPALNLVKENLDVGILEVSSFQLESIDAFRPKIAILLNLSEDHLDRHGSFEAYAASKARIFKNQTSGDISITNCDQNSCLEVLKRDQNDVRTFGVESRGTHAWLDDETAFIRWGEEVRKVQTDCRRPPSIAKPNVLASLLAVASLGIDPDRVAPSLSNYVGLPHRLEEVCTKNGIKWINDSKATNPEAASNALEGFTGPVIWIAGGRDKGLKINSLACTASKKVKRAILFGECAPKMASALKDLVPIEQVLDIQEAVKSAALHASSGDTVLLAPACSSFDQFSNFEERGDHFRIAVENLLERS